MSRRIPIIVPLSLLLTLAMACTNKKVQNPLANVGSKQPDKVLFDRAMDALKHNRFDVARMTLQTLINTYPDSEFIARAKLAVADSWYDEGGSTALTQAEIEYKDFITFFPNMPEAAEAQLKVANIHYRQMEKPDRDRTEAKAAEGEFQTFLSKYPKDPLAPKATQHLRTVQEGLAEGDRLHAIQEGFWEEHGLQCGYCTPGMILCAHDLLERNATPNEQEIREALDGNICRCTGYQHILNSVQAASRKLRNPSRAAAASHSARRAAYSLPASVRGRPECTTTTASSAGSAMVCTSSVRQSMRSACPARPNSAAS